MYRAMKQDGVVDKKIGKKGVLLARRDNSSFVRNVYEHVITQISNNESRDDILDYVMNQIRDMFTNRFLSSEFVVTKGVGSCGNLTAEPCTNDKGQPRAKVGDYMLPLLSNIKDEREKQLEKKGASCASDFYLLCLPAQVQLAERMRRRGQRVDTGQRLEYLVTDIEHHTAKQYEKVESIEYFNQFSHILTVDHYYYLKALATPLDQMLNVAFNRDEKYPQDFVMNLYKFLYQKRRKVIEEIKSLGQPKIRFE